MSMTPTDQTVTKAPRRSLKPAAAFAAAGLLATVAWVGAHQTGDDVRTDKTRLEALDDRTVETAGRHSRELAAPPTSSDSGEPTSTEPTSAGPTTTGTGPPTTAPTTTDRNGVGTSGGSGRASGSYGPLLGQAGTATGPSSDQSPGGGDGTLWLPGTDAEAPITGPPRPPAGPAGRVGPAVGRGVGRALRSSRGRPDPVDRRLRRGRAGLPQPRPGADRWLQRGPELDLFLPVHLFPGPGSGRVGFTGPRVWVPARALA